MRGKLAQREVIIAVAAAEGGGTALRADAQVIWTRPESSREHVPSGVRDVLVKARDPEHHVSFERTVRDRAKVKRLEWFVEGLLPAPRPGGKQHCQREGNGAPMVDLSFHGLAHRRPLAHLRIDANACPSILRTHGRTQPPVEGAQEAISKLEKLLGHRL